MVYEYLKKLRQDLIENMEKSETMILAQIAEKDRLDELLNTMVANLKYNVELGKITEDDVVRMAEQLTVFLSPKDEAIEQLKKMPPMSLFSLDDNGRIALAESKILNNEDNFDLRKGPTRRR